MSLQVFISMLRYELMVHCIISVLCTWLRVCLKALMCTLSNIVSSIGILYLLIIGSRIYNLLLRVKIILYWLYEFHLRLLNIF